MFSPIKLYFSFISTLSPLIYTLSLHMVLQTISIFCAWKFFYQYFTLTLYALDSCESLLIVKFLCDELLSNSFLLFRVCFIASPLILFLSLSLANNLYLPFFEIFSIRKGECQSCHSPTIVLKKFLIPHLFLRELLVR
ncbi:hypothetical protein H311_03993 [Anncaliia algerae PRA109]|nr:hypothetical protein H311_03993 [Anncaliia algerae PRA109]